MILQIRHLIVSALNPSTASGAWLAHIKLGVRIQGGHHDPDSGIVSGLERGKVLSAIDSLPHIQRAWVQFSHGPLRRSDKEVVKRHLLACLPITINDKWLALADIAVDDATRRILSEGSRPPHPAAVYQHAIGVKERSFFETWAPRRDAMLFAISDKIDGPAIEGVRRCLKKRLAIPTAVLYSQIYSAGSAPQTKDFIAAPSR